MKRNIIMRVLFSGILLIGLAGVMVSLNRCGELFEEVMRENQEARDSRIVIAGSTSMEKFANILAESFMEDYPDIKVTAEFIGSSAGVEAVLSGRADIGISSRELTDEERTDGAVGSIVAIDGMAVITDPDNPVTALTIEQLTDIYTGRIRNWRDIGGIDEPIVVTGRESGSGTRNIFEELLGIRDMCLYANEMDSEGAVVARIASTPGGIGYVSFDVLNDKVCALAIDGVEATEENVKAGSYTLCRPFLMVTKGEVAGQKAVVRKFFDYLQSEAGEQLIRRAGLSTPGRS